jgi:uncharacterized protein YnzC (UPF0291/DUF896 family)
MDLLDSHLTQQEIAERNGYSQAKISDYQKKLLSEIAEIAKTDNEKLL